jgi:uncharacterized protein (DUF885 family)
MKATTFAVAVSLPLSIFAQSPSPSASPTTDEKFQQLASAYIEEELGSNLEQATELGDHRFDDILTDYSPASRVRILAAQKQFKIEASALDLVKLSQTNNVDLRILKDSIDNRIFDLEELKDVDWNPLVYNQSLANSLYLVARVARHT